MSMERQGQQIEDINRRIASIETRLTTLEGIPIELARIEGAVSMIKYAIPIIVAIGALLIGWLEYASRH